MKANLVPFILSILSGTALGVMTFDLCNDLGVDIVWNLVLSIICGGIITILFVIWGTYVTKEHD